MPERYVILLDGTIGVGKSTMGRELALLFDGTFIDGDDHKTKGKPWYCSSLTTCRSILETGIRALQEKPIIFIGRPMRCLDWLYFTRHFERSGVRVLSVGLQATFENITNKARGRLFSQYERERMMEMIYEGYGSCPYSDLHLRTDELGIEKTVSKLESSLQKIIQGQNMR